MQFPTISLTEFVEHYYRNFRYANSLVPVDTWPAELKDSEYLKSATGALHYVNYWLRNACCCFAKFRLTVDGHEYPSAKPFKFDDEVKALEFHVGALKLLCIDPTATDIETDYFRISMECATDQRRNVAGYVIVCSAELKGRY